MLEGSPWKLAVPYVCHIPHQAIHSLPSTVSHQDSIVTLEATWSDQVPCRNQQCWVGCNRPSDAGQYLTQEIISDVGHGTRNTLVLQVSLYGAPPEMPLLSG